MDAGQGGQFLVERNRCVYTLNVDTEVVMGAAEEDSERQRASAFRRVLGSAPWLRPTAEKKRFKVKVFKSGNSVALRLPAGLELKPGTEMELTAEGNDQYSFEPIQRPKRKFNIAKVAGSAVSLQLITDGYRLFEERALIWPGSGEAA